MASNAKVGHRGQFRKEFEIHIDFAKKLCMVSKSKKGEEIRNELVQLTKKIETGLLLSKELVSNHLLPSKAQRIQLVTESAVYKMALASNLEKAKPFRDWVTYEILPSIRKNGYYSIANQSLAIMMHTNISIQKSNSKEINTKNFIESGVESVIEYNRNSCLLHTGKTPSEIKKIGKKKGLKSVERNSAKEVLRHTNPELACAMSFTDSLVTKGFDLKTVSELSLKCAVPLFEGMIELGIKPKELDK